MSPSPQIADVGTDLSFVSGMSVDTIATMLFLVTLVCYLVFTLIFFFHWQQYSTNARVSMITYVLYGATTVPIMLTLGIITLTV